MYDLWLLTHQGILLDPILVARKLATTDTAFTEPGWRMALAQAGHTWERDLRPLLPQLPDWETVAAYVEVILANLTARLVKPGPNK